MSSQKLELAELIKVASAKHSPVSVVLIEAQPCHLTRDAFSSREATTQIGLDFPFSFFPLKLLTRSADGGGGRKRGSRERTEGVGTPERNDGESEGRAARWSDTTGHEPAKHCHEVVGQLQFGHVHLTTGCY